MNTTIDLKTAKTIEAMNQKVNHMDTAVTDFFNKMSDVLERQFGDDEVYAAVIAPEIELTITPLANVRSYLPCFDETDSCYSISEDVPLALCYDPRQVITLAGKRYLSGAVIFVRYDTDGNAIEHDPWQLTSFLTTLYDDYTRSEVQAKLKETFAKQYKLTTWVEVQIRYKTVWVISPAGIPVPTQVPYEYRIFHTKLVNKGLEVVIREELDNDQWKRYEIFQDTLGGRPYLFNGGLPPGGSDGSGAPGIDYQVPAEALTDSEFAAIYKEAQKYVGTPYVWGGSTPETGFDCSGYVCWVYNQNGYDVGRTTANGLWNKSQHISEAEAKPGDLVFFEGTYDTPGKSHVGIYLGNGKMVSAGDPIKYADIHSSYWQKYRPVLDGFQNDWRKK